MERSKFGLILLVIHGLICMISAFLPFYPLVLIFYFLVHTSFAVKAIMVLIIGAIQVGTGTYWLLEGKPWRPKWYWFAMAAAALVGIMLIYPAIHPPGLFSMK